MKIPCLLRVNVNFLILRIYQSSNLPLIHQSESLNSITSSGETHKQYFEKWLDENAPRFSMLSFNKLANLAQEIEKDGIDALDGSDVSTLRRKLELDTPPLYQIIGENIDLYVKTKHTCQVKNKTRVSIGLL